MNSRPRVDRGGSSVKVKFKILDRVVIGAGIIIKSFLL